MLESCTCIAIAGGAMNLGAAAGWTDLLQALDGGEARINLTQRLLEPQSNSGQSMR